MDFSNYTENEDFNKNGFLHLPNLIDTKQFHEGLPEPQGGYTWGEYIGPLEEEEDDGISSRCNEPKYWPLVKALKEPIGKLLGRKIKHTYWFDRWYVPGQNLYRHKDWPCCEISVTLHLQSNTSELWPIGIRTHEGHEYLLNLKEGDAMIYNGTYREHWRPYLPYEYNEDGTEKEGISYHQIFIHYVMADGEWGHLGYDDLPEIGTDHNTGPDGNSLPYNLLDWDEMQARVLEDERNYTRAGGKRWYKNRFKNGEYRIS